MANARASSPAIAAGAVRWKNDRTKLASAMPKIDAARAQETRVVTALVGVHAAF